MMRYFPYTSSFFQLLATFFSLASLVAFSDSSANFSDTLRNAENAYLNGLKAQQGNDRAAATAAFATAIKLYGDVLGKADFDNAKLRYNLANVHLARKELGLAIHHYKKALELEPDNSSCAHNLEVARTLRKDQLKPDETDRVLKTLFAFHYDVPYHARRTAFYVVYALAFALIAVRVLTKKHMALTVAISISAIATVMLATSLLISWNQRKLTSGVITAKVVHAKAGSSNAYADAFDEPLHDGTEFTLVEADDSGQWLHVILDNGQKCWLPAHATLVQRK